MGDAQKWPTVGQVILVQDVPTTEAQRELWKDRQPPTRKGEVVEVPRPDGSGFLVIDVGGEYGGVNYAARDFGSRYTWKPFDPRVDAGRRPLAGDGRRDTSDGLTLTAIDGMRHLTASEDVVAAVAFAARAGHSTRTAYRFVTALVMTDALKNPTRWGDILKLVMDLEAN